jgi:hypothetical protein
MRRDKIVARILFMFFIANAVLSAPALLRQRHESEDDSSQKTPISGYSAGGSLSSYSESSSDSVSFTKSMKSSDNHDTFSASHHDESSSSGYLPGYEASSENFESESPAITKSSENHDTSISTVRPLPNLDSSSALHKSSWTFVSDHYYSNKLSEALFEGSPSKRPWPLTWEPLHDPFPLSFRYPIKPVLEKPEKEEQAQEQEQEEKHKDKKLKGLDWDFARHIK